VREDLGPPAAEDDDWGIRQPSGPPPSRLAERDWSARRVRVRRRRKVLKWTALVLVAALVVAGAVGAYGFRYTNRLLDKGRTQVGGLAQADAGQPFNMLLVGSDSRVGLSDGDKHRLAVGEAAGQRTDTIIVVHVSPRNRKVAMISIPRDLKVNINGRTAKVNSA